jgi:hypothetical protein
MRHVTFWVLAIGSFPATACGGDDGGGGPGADRDPQAPDAASEAAAEVAADGSDEDPVLPDVSTDTTDPDVPACENPCYPVNARECADATCGTQLNACCGGSFMGCM